MNTPDFQTLLEELVAKVTNYIQLQSRADSAHEDAWDPHVDAARARDRMWSHIRECKSAIEKAKREATP